MATITIAKEEARPLLRQGQLSIDDKGVFWLCLGRLEAQAGDVLDGRGRTWRRWAAPRAHYVNPPVESPDGFVRDVIWDIDDDIDIIPLIETNEIIDG